jgi:uncharacterized damage-inducible protein DinB
MRRAERMVLQLQLNFDGKAWHGTPLRRMVDGIGEGMANLRRIPNARTIAELLAHVTAWIEIVQRRLAGERFEVTPEIDFPSVEGVKWSDAVSRLELAHDKLLETVGAMSDSDFEATVPDKNYTAGSMLHGLINHNAYHAGQIALLKK